MIVNFQRLGTHILAQWQLGGVASDARSRSGGSVRAASVSEHSEHSAQNPAALYSTIPLTSATLKGVPGLGTQRLGTQSVSQSHAAGSMHLSDEVTPVKNGKDKDKEQSGKKQRKSQIEHSLEQGREIQKAAQSMDWNSQWGKQMRRREFDTMRGRLGNHARKLAAFVDHEGSANLSFQLFAAEEQLVARQELIENIRTDFVGLVSCDLSESHKTLLRDAPPSLLCTILTQKAQFLIDELPTSKDASAHCAIFIGVIISKGQQIKGPRLPTNPQVHGIE